MLYTEKEKNEIERVKEVFAEHLRQSPDFELLWSDKVGYVWLTIGVNPLYVDTGIRIESAADLCGRCLDDVATDVLYMTGNDHALEAADPLELAEIKRREIPCRVSSDPHERRNDLSAVSTMHPVKLKYQ